MSEVCKTEVGKAYFVTLTVVNWMDVFIRPEYANILFKNITYCQANKGLEVFAYCLMSSHLHMVALGKTTRLTEILRDLKSYSAKQIIEAVESNPQESRKEWLCSAFERHGRYNPHNKRYQFWIQDNHPIELFSKDVILQKVEYIHQNPVKAGIVAWAEHYVYSSASPYSPLRCAPL